MNLSHLLLSCPLQNTLWTLKITRNKCHYNRSFYLILREPVNVLKLAVRFLPKFNPAFYCLIHPIISRPLKKFVQNNSCGNCMGVVFGQINHSYEAVVTEICPPEFTSPTPGWELQLQLSQDWLPLELSAGHYHRSAEAVSISTPFPFQSKVEEISLPTMGRWCELTWLPCTRRD